MRPRQLAAEPPIGSLDLALGAAVRKLRFALDRLVAKRAWASHLVVEAVALDRDGGPVPGLAPAGLGLGPRRAPVRDAPGCSQCFSHVDLTPLLKLGAHDRTFP